MHKVLRMFACSSVALLCMIIFSLLVPATAHASTNPGSTTTAMAGAYLVDVDLSPGTPFTDQPFAVTVVSHNHALHLTGQLVDGPGLGTDAANIYAHLTPQTGEQYILRGSLRLPVRGAWQITVELDGPQGHGQTSIAVVAAAPGAMPVWLAWSIGAIPALGLLAWSLQQGAYRRRLLSAA